MTRTGQTAGPDTDVRGALPRGLRSLLLAELGLLGVGAAASAGHRPSRCCWPHIPIAYFTGTNFKPARRRPLHDVAFHERWGQTTTPQASPTPASPHAH